MFFSLITSIISYFNLNSIFTISAIILSFSSGIIILFSYCALITIYEEKIKNKTGILIFIIILIIIFSSQTNLYITEYKKTLENSISPSFLTIAIILILISIICINKRILNPQKSLNNSF